MTLVLSECLLMYYIIVMLDFREIPTNFMKGSQIVQTRCAGNRM